MKKLLLPFLGILILASCGHKPSGSHKPSPGDKVMDIITITDDGVTYADTIMHVIPGAKITPDDPKLSVEETGTGRFAPKYRNQAIIEGDSLECSISKHHDTASFALICSEHPQSFPISMQIGARALVSGVGVYKAKGIETSANGNDTMCVFSEDFKGGQQYLVDSVVVNITKATDNQVSGNYKLWLTNTFGSKIVTGTIDCNAAWIGNANVGLVQESVQ